MHSNVDAMMEDGNNWRAIDRELRSIAKRQRALDAEEAALLCVVARQQIWRQFGCATMLEYLEMIFGYGPKVGHERVRVAMAIEALPELRDALANGEVSYSALRELTRVVTPNTQREWLDAVRGKSVRQVEDLVRTHRKGDLPTDPADPDLKLRRLQFEVSTATDALLRQARQSLANERGRFIEDDEFLAAMAAALLEGGANDNEQGRAKFQIRVTACDSCTATYFEGGGRKIAVNDADAARADCDAQRIGEDERAAQDIAPKTRRDVIHRDGGRCTVPGCRSARFIEVHHIVPRSQGGSHHASNLVCLCDGHHKALHEGKLVLSGSAPNIIVRFVHDPHVETPARVSHAEMRHIETASRALIAAQAPHAEMTATPHVETHVTARHVGPTSTASVYSTAVMRAEAKQALQKLGFKPPISKKCVDAALASRPPPTTLEQLIRAALKHSLIGTSTVTLAAPESTSRGHR
jgi:hypothetical protein